MQCEHERRDDDLRAKLDDRLEQQWSKLLSGVPLEPSPEGRRVGPPPEGSTSSIVEALRLQATLTEELFQACDAPEAIRQRIGGVAMLLDKRSSEPFPRRGKVVLPSRTIQHDENGEDVCPSEWAGDDRELASSNGGTLFFLDRHHLVGAGHLFRQDTICGAAPGTVRLSDFLIVFGLTNGAITDHGTVEIPVEHVIDGSTVTVVECHGNETRDSEGDWVLLRTDECICGAMPLPARWDRPIAKGEEVHVLGHPNQLTMKYSLPSKVGSSSFPFPLFRMDLVTDNGHSGSPIFDGDGNVVGIHGGRRKAECLLDCKTNAGPCCRRARCSDHDCLLDGYATHIQRVQEAWKRSQREIPSKKECESK